MNQRFKEEIEELKSDLISKDKIINRLNMNREFILRTAYNAQDDIDMNIINSNSNSDKGLFKIKRNSSKKLTLNDQRNLDFSLLNDTNEEIKSKSKCLKTDVSIREENLRYISRNSNDKIKNFNNLNNTTDKLSLNNLGKFINTNNNINNKLNDDINEEEDCDEFLKEKIDSEINNILLSRKNFILSTMTYENFSFEICNRLKTNKTNNNIDNNLNDKKLNENLDLILNKIQQRKEKVIMQKKLMQTKMEKIGIKLF